MNWAAVCRKREADDAPENSDRSTVRKLQAEPQWIGD